MSNAALKYQSKLDLRETEVEIKKTKDIFESNLAEALDLTRVSAPIFIRGGKGINDDLAGNERIVSFDALDVENERIEIVQSLAKWKRMALKRYGFSQGEGLYTDMNAIRRDETLDNLHSLYVDQWDWEKVISRKQRNVNTLKITVKKNLRWHQKVGKLFGKTLSCFKLHPAERNKFYLLTGTGGSVSRFFTKGARGYNHKQVRGSFYNSNRA